MVSEFKGYGVHPNTWGWRAMHVTHPNHPTPGNWVYANDKCYDSLTNHTATMPTSWLEGKRLYCDVCDCHYNGEEGYTELDWYRCDEWLNLKKDGDTIQCKGHTLFGYGGVELGRVKCTYRRVGDNVQRKLDIMPASGATAVVSNGAAAGTWINCEQIKDSVTLGANWTYPQRVTFTKRVRKSNGTYVNQSRDLDCGYNYVFTDWVKPTAYGYSNVITNNSNWKVEGNGTQAKPSTQAWVTVTFKDPLQYIYNTLNVRIYDSDQKTLLAQPNGDTLIPLNQNPKDKTLYTGRISIPTETTSQKNIYIQAIDSTGNTSALIPMRVQYLDSKGPTLTQNINIANDKWAKEKILTIEGHDAFNTVNIGYSKTNMVTVSNSTYGNKRQYKLTGDLYDRNVTITYYGTDAVGNITIIKNTVTKLDATPPTIVSVSQIKQDLGNNFTNAKITVTANDINQKLNKTGSGVIGYAMTETNRAPDLNSNLWQTSNILTAVHNKTYYIWAKDLAGNISAEPKSITIENLTAPYQIQHYKRNAKGTYDLADTETKIDKTDSKVSVILNPRRFPNYLVDPDHSESVLSGIVKPDGTLALKLYYEPDVATGEMESDTQVRYYNSGGNVASAVTFKAKKNEFKRRGYEFGKWLNGSPTGEEVAEGEDVPFNPPIDSTETTKTLYAKWIYVWD